MPLPASNAEVSSALYRCLSPNADARPSASELRAILSGRRAGINKMGLDSALASSAVYWSAAPRSLGEPIISNSLELREAGGRSMSIRVRTELSKTLMCSSLDPTGSSGMLSNA